MYNCYVIDLLQLYPYNTIISFDNTLIQLNYYTTIKLLLYVVITIIHFIKYKNININLLTKSMYSFNLVEK